MSQLAASTRDWVKSCAIDWILDASVFSCGSTLFTDCMWNISMTYYTSFCISRLCPLLYIAACAPGINHFPASLLHEMKEFIMLTVAIARRSLWFIWEKLIDSLTQSEQSFAAGEPQRTLLNVAVCVQRTCLLYGGVYLVSPVAAYMGSCVATSAHYLAGAVTDLKLGSSNLWQITERSICLPT